MGEPSFLIIHRSSGKYMNPEGKFNSKEYGPSIVLNDLRMLWKFEKVRGQWGYIKHVESQKYIHPHSGELDAEDTTPLVLRDDRHDGALFALDVFKHRIVYLNGCFAQPKDSTLNPPDETKVILHSKVSYANHFIFIERHVNDKDALIYGKPELKGEWKMLSMVRNPSATHIEHLTVKVGQSSSTMHDDNVNKFPIKIDISVIIIIIKGSDPDAKQMFKKISPDTWSVESTQTGEKRVEPGKTVVTWQYVFTLDYCGTTLMFKSNLLADTASEMVEPEELFPSTY